MVLGCNGNRKGVCVMNIWIIVEPEYENSYWCIETMRGIRRQAVGRRYILKQIVEEQIEKIQKTDIVQVIMVLGTSITWLYQITQQILNVNLKCILISGSVVIPGMVKVSTLLLDYYSSMQILLTHLRNTGNQRIAFFGSNPNSYADKCKVSIFPWKQDIYYNFGSIVTCGLQILKKIRDYDAVICANDAVAIYLLHFLRKYGILIPQDLKLVSFGDFLMSQFMDPSITSIAQDYCALGKQAVNIYTFQVKNPRLTINAFVDCKLKIRESTGDKLLSFDMSSTSAFQVETLQDIHFYEDAPIATILALEKLLIDADEVDLKILQMLLFKKPFTLEKIAEKLNLSLSGLNYRIRKMKSNFEGNSSETMFQTIYEYFSDETLQKVIEWKVNKKNQST